MRAIAIAATLLATQSLAVAQEDVSQQVADDFISAALAQPNVSLLSPAEIGSEHLVPIKKKEDVQKLASLISASIKDSDGTILGCWNPHHAIRVQRGTEKITIELCFHCVRGHYWVNDHVYWFTISRKQEAEMNELFHRYGLPGSKS